MSSNERAPTPNYEDDVSSIEVIQAKMSNSASELGKVLDHQPQIETLPTHAVIEQKLDEAKKAHGKEKEEMKL